MLEEIIGALVIVGVVLFALNLIFAGICLSHFTEEMDGHLCRHLQAIARLTAELAAHELLVQNNHYRTESI